jgi:hypothetical protein
VAAARVNRWYKASFAFAGVFLLALAVSAYVSTTPAPEARGSPGPDSSEWQNASAQIETGRTGSGTDAALLISTAVLIITAFGTISTMVLGWRSDRRQVAELELRRHELQLRKSQVRRKPKKSQ